MAKTKEKVEKVIVEDTKVETTVNQELLRVIEIYKVQNPKKYELKKAELEAKLKQNNAR